MTQVLQSGQHPDADQLNAFVEHALPPHEQQQMLAHLASCPECRAIAYLAQSAVEEEVARPQPVVARKPWFAGWNLALPAGLAIAFLIILSVHLRNVGTSARNAAVDKTAHLELASSLPQTAEPTTQAVAPKPLPAPIQKPQNAVGLLSNASVAGSASNKEAKRPEPQPLRLKGPFAADGQAVAPVPGPGIASNAAFAGQPRQAIAPQSARAATPAAAPASASASGAGQAVSLGNVDAVHRELRSSSSQYNSATVTAQSNLNQAFQAATPPPPAPPEASRSVNETVTVTSAAPMLETDSTQSSQLIAGNATGSLAGSALKMKQQASLPSHLAAVSTVSNAWQELAIDSAGSLFRSEDAGVTWQPISAQWTGRAVKLQLTPSPNLQATAKSANAGAAMGAAKPASTAVVQPGFELTNDAGNVWISADGQTWKRK